LPRLLISAMLLLHRGEDFDPNFYHASGLDIDHSFLLLEGKKRTLLVPRMNERQARAIFKGKVLAYRDPIEALKPLLKGRMVGFDASSESASMYLKLRKLCRLEDRSKELSLSRIRKTPQERSHVRKAVRATKEILSSLDLDSARSELELKGQILMRIMEAGLEPSFEPIVASGSSSALPHHRAGRRKLSSLVLVDMGVREGRYCSDLTRCFIRGNPELETEYEDLQGVFHSIADRIPECLSGGQIASMAREEIERAGLPPLIHSIGHGIGLEVHEKPALNEKSKDPIKGSCMAIEPAFYKARYGMRYEETLYFDGRKASVL